MSPNVCSCYNATTVDCSISATTGVVTTTTESNPSSTSTDGSTGGISPNPILSITSNRVTIASSVLTAIVASIGAIVLLAILIILIVFFKRKRAGTGRKSIEMRVKLLKDIQIIHKIGQGNFGEVYYGKMVF